MMIEYAIYGAGEIGRQALSYYGDSQVAFFIDKSSEKQKSGYLGKKVYDVTDNTVCEFEGHIIIAVSDRFRVEIEQILLSAGKRNYSFYEGVRTAKICEFFDENPIKQFETIGIYGTGKDAGFIREIITRNLKYSGNIIMVDQDHIADSDEEVFSLKEAITKCSAIIIGSEKYHLSIELRIEKYMEQEGIKCRILSPFKLRYYYSPHLLVFDKYRDGQEAQSEEEMILSKKSATYAIDKLKDYVQETGEYTPLFNSIEIETYNKCNGVCEFCPVNVKDDPRKHIFMEEKLFMKIVNELKEMDYNGRVSLFSNNEPLLDDRIYEFSRILREALPNATIHMFTNGTLFTLEKFKKLIPYLDELIIDNYNQNLELIPPVRIIKDYCESNPELIKKVGIVMRKPKEILTTRGGEAPNRKLLEVYEGVPCQLPYRQMVIRPDGGVSLCCNDPLGKNNLGNVSINTLKEVWYGEKYMAVRKLISQGRENYEYCRYCDVFSCYL